MTDEQIRNTISEAHIKGWPIRAVLLAKGGWVNAEEIDLTAVHGMWKLSRFNENGVHLDSLYLEAATIIGIAIQRHSHGKTTEQGNEGTAQEGGASHH